MSLKKIYFILIHILISTSCFSQWQVINSNTNQNLVDGCFINDSTGFIIGANGLILKTTDKGNSWSPKTTLSGVFTSISKVNKDTLIAGGNCIYKSYNGGTTWNLVTTLPYTITDLGFFGAKNGFIIAPSDTSCTSSAGTITIENYKMYKSNDYGVSWQYYAQNFGHTSYFEFINDSSLIIPTGNAFNGTIHCGQFDFLSAIRTNDRGANWFTINQPAYGYPFISFINDTLGYYIQAGKPFMFKTINGGNGSLSPFNTNISDPTLRQCKFITENQGYLVAQQTIFKTNSRGINWSNDYTSGNTLNFLFKNTDSVLIGLGDYGLIIKKITSPHIPIDTMYQAELDKTSIDFGNVNVNSSKLDSIKIKNIGNSPATFSINSSNNFKINFNTNSFVNNLNVTLNPLQDTLVYVQFNPLLAQNYGDTITVGSYGKNRKIPVKGTGINGLCGTIAQDTIICVDTLKICGDLTILPTAKMTICAGTYVQVLGYYQITVQGILKALGTNSDSIIFSAKSFTNIWKGILVYSNILGDSTTFAFCRITGICSNPSIQNLSGRLNIDHCNISNQASGVSAVYISGYYSRLHLSNSEISSINSAGISIDGDSTYIISNKIHGSGKGISFSTYSGLIIKNNEIYNNSQVGIYGYGVADIINNDIHDNDGGISLLGAWNNNKLSRIENNTIYNNSQAGIFVQQVADIISNDIHDNVGGISLIGQAKIENNKIYNNRAADFGGIKIVSAGYGYLPSVNQNLIFNNSAINYGGAGIKIESALSGGPTLTLSLVNNTICNNKIENSGVGHNVYAYSSSPPLNVYFFNNIIYSSFDAFNNFILHPNVTSTVENNSINQSGLNALGQNNINNYPEFMSPTSSSGVLTVLGSYDWSLKQNSTCIEGGDSLSALNLFPFDFSGNPRIYNTRVDIGAYEYQGLYDAIEEKRNIASFRIFPNPFNENISITTDQNGECEIKLYNVTSVMILHQKFKNACFLNTEYLSKGIYIYEIRNSAGESSKGKLINR